MPAGGTSEPAGAQGKVQGKVLVLGDDMRAFLAVVRSLGRAGHSVHAVPYKQDAPALASRYIDRVHTLPPHAGEGVVWRRAMRSLIDAHRFDLVIPCCDRGILMFAAHRDHFADVAIALPSPQAIASLFDKHETRRLAERLGVPVAPGRMVEPGDDAATLVAEYGLPLAIKERRSYRLDDLSRRGEVTIVDDAKQLEATLAGRRPGDEMLVESFFVGTGVGVSVIASDGAVLTAFQHRRLREPVGGGGSYLRESEPVRRDMRDAVEAICRDTAFTGVAMFEFRDDTATGAWILLEVNARFWGSLPLPLSLGVDFPRYLYELLVDGREVSQVTYEHRVRGRNLLVNAYDVLLRARSARSNEAEAGGELVRLVSLPWNWLRGRERIDEFVADDLRPALREIAHAQGTLLQAARRRGRARVEGRGVVRAAKP